MVDNSFVSRLRALHYLVLMFQVSDVHFSLSNQVLSMRSSPCITSANMMYECHTASRSEPVIPGVYVNDVHEVKCREKIDSCDYGSVVTRMTLPSASNKPCIVVDSPELGGETYARVGRRHRPIFTVNCRILNLPNGLESCFQMRVILNDVTVGAWNLSTKCRALRDSEGAIPFRVNLPVFIGGVYALNLELINRSSSSVHASCRRAFGITTQNVAKPVRPRRERPFHRLSKRIATRIIANPNTSIGLAESNPKLQSGESRPLRSSSPSWPLESGGSPDSSGEGERRGEALSDDLRKPRTSPLEIGGAEGPWIGGSLAEPSRGDGESGAGPADAGWDLWQFGAGPLSGRADLSRRHRTSFTEPGTSLSPKRRPRAAVRNPPPPAAAPLLGRFPMWATPLPTQGAAEAGSVRWAE
jgi:hypothetical protein